MKKLRNVMRKCMASLLVLCMAAAPCVTEIGSGYYAEVIVNGKVYADVKIQKELEHSKIAVSGHFETAMYCHR